MRRRIAIAFALFAVAAGCSGKKQEEPAGGTAAAPVADAASVLSQLPGAVPPLPTGAADAAAAAAPGAITDDGLADHGLGHDGRGLYYARALTTADLDGRSLRDLALMRNTIYARAGHGFRKAWLREHFTTLAWYQPRDQDDNTKVTATDRANAKLIAARESAYSRDAMVAEQATLAGKTERTTVEDVELRLLGEQLGHAAGTQEATAPPRSPLEDPSQLDRLLTVDELGDLSRRDLRILRNTVYARHGRVFKSVLLQDWFDNKDWYHPDEAFAESQLTSVDKKNVRLIRSVEDSLGGPLTDHEQKVEDGWWDAA